MEHIYQIYNFHLNATNVAYRFNNETSDAPNRLITIIGRERAPAAATAYIYAFGNVSSLVGEDAMFAQGLMFAF